MKFMELLELSGFLQKLHRMIPIHLMPHQRQVLIILLELMARLIIFRYIISNCSNNYGPNQFPEKLIPLFINNILEEKISPVYGDGNYTRDWLYVKDHAKAIALIF